MEWERPGKGRDAPRHVAGLDGLRGAAVIAVVAYHLRWIPGGFLGVDVFFVLSGFLVTSLVLAEVERTGRLDLRSFWGRRIRRLVPAVLVLVPAVFGLALAVGWQRSRLGDLGTDGVATLTWWANWRQAAGASYWAPSPSPFRHAWSLSIEEQFYLVWPVVVVGLVWLARRRSWPVHRVVGGVAGLAALAGATWMVVLARSLPAEGLSRAYVGTDTRLMAPLAGCALACWWRSPARREVSRRTRGLLQVGAHAALAALVAMVLVVHVPDPALYRSGGFALAAAAAALLVSALVARESTAGGRGGLLAVFAWAPVRRVGTRSYAIYLWSWPLQVMVETWHPEWDRTRVTVVVVAAAVLLAEISYALVEDPLRRQRSWAARPVLRRPAWALALALPVVALLAVNQRAVPPAAFEKIDTAQAVAQARHAPPPETPRGGWGTREAPDARDLRVMLVGDSTAFTAGWNAPSPKALPPGIASIDGRGVIGCGLLASSGWDYPRRDEPGFAPPAAGACAGQADAERIGLTGHPDVVLLMAGAWEYQAVRSPGGTVMEARSPEIRKALVRNLVERAATADRAGAALAISTWACPGSKASPQRRDPAYIRWVNDVFAEGAAAARHEGYDAQVLPVSTAICVDGDAAAGPTDAWRTATDDEVHVRTPEGGALLWDRWFGPTLAAQYT